MKNIKYNIYINQLAIFELNPELDVVDASIIDYLYILCNSLSEKIEEKRIKTDDGSWTWVDFGTLLDQMPLLHLKSRSSLSAKIKKIEECGYVHTLKRRIKGHIRLFVRMNGKVDSLYVYTNRPVRLDEQAPEKPVRVAAPIMYISNTIHNDIKTGGESPSLFEEFWNEYPSKKGKVVALRSWSKIDPSLHQKIVEDVRNRKKDRSWLEGFIPNPSTYLNQERWNDDITPPKIPIRISADTPYIEGKYKNIKSTKINL